MKSVIVLHGWGLSADRFAPLRICLEKIGYRVFVPDLPGFGLSKQPEKALTLSDYVEFLHTFIKQKKIDKPILLGHSFGGRVALKYQCIHQDSVHALILTGTPGYTPIPRKRLAFFIAVAKFGKVLSVLPPFCFFRETIRNWYYYVVGARDYYRATSIMRQTFKNIVAERLESYMKNVSVPVLLAWGSDDRITPIWIARRMKESIKGAVLSVIPGTDHGVSYKHPDLFICAIEPFLTSL